MVNILKDATQELFIAMSTRWIKNDGSLATGVSRKQILQKTDIKAEVLDDLIMQVKEKVDLLGLEVVEYTYESDLWYTLRSNYVAPNELNPEEEATLAVIIEFLEKQKDPTTANISLDKINDRLVKGKYFTNSSLDRSLRKLEYLGYINRKRKKISYKPRTLIEFSEISRKHIAEESSKLMF